MMLFGVLLFTATVDAVPGDFSVGNYTPKEQCSEILTCNKSTIQWNTANNRFEYFQKCTANQSDFTDRIDRLTVASYAVATIVGENLDECVSGGLDAVKKSYRKSYSEFYSPRKSKFESGPRFKFAKFDGDVFSYKGSYETDGGYMPGELCSEFVPRIENGKPNRSRGYEPTTTVFHLHCGNRTSFKNGCDATAKVVPIKMKSAKNSILSKKLAVYKEPDHQIDEIMYHVQHGCQIKEVIPFSSLYVEWDVSEMNIPLVFSDRVLQQLHSNQQSIQDTFVQEDIDALKEGGVTAQQVRVPFLKVSQQLKDAVERKQQIEQCSIQVQGALDKIATLDPLDPRRETLQANILEKDEQVEGFLTQVDTIFLKRKTILEDELVEHQRAVNRDIAQAQKKIEFLHLRLTYYQNKQQKHRARTEKLESVFGQNKKDPSGGINQQPGSESQSQSQRASQQKTDHKNDYSGQAALIHSHISDLQQYVKRRKTVLLRLSQTHETMTQTLDKKFHKHERIVQRITDKWKGIMAQSEQIQVHSVSKTSGYENRTPELKRCRQDYTSLSQYHKNYNVLSGKLETLENQFSEIAQVQSSLETLETVENEIQTAHSFEKQFKQLSDSTGRNLLLNETLSTSSWSKKLQLGWQVFLSRQRIRKSIEQWTSNDTAKASEDPE